MSATVVRNRESAPGKQSLEATVVVAEGNSISIPPGVRDLDSFRQWAHSDHFPESGWISWLDGELWVDASTEELFTHNQVKAAFDLRLLTLVESVPTGRFIVDRMRLTHPTADLSVEPDGLFFRWETVKEGRLRFVEGAKGGYMELEGTPDMVLEILSRSSVAKDTRILRELYWKAEVPEYWLVDARGEELQFDILRRTSKSYRRTENKGGWLHSTVFDRSFRLLRTSDPLGHPQYVLEIRED